MHRKIKEDEGGWSPYLAGALAGLVLVGSVWFTGKYYGASTAFVRMAGMIENLFNPEHVAGLAYFAQKTPKIEWQWMFDLGILIGAFISAITSGSFQSRSVPARWEARFGHTPGKRGLVAFIGGVIAMFGARLAGGCPSGHGLSGSLQLAPSGYIAIACFFIGGIVVAHILYGGQKQ
jgi:uncharacterized membrane protein YedE/YeeE